MVEKVFSKHSRKHQPKKDSAEPAEERKELFPHLYRFRAFWARHDNAAGRHQPVGFSPYRRIIRGAVAFPNHAGMAFHLAVIHDVVWSIHGRQLFKMYAKCAGICLRVDWLYGGLIAVSPQHFNISKGQSQ